jgi:hypothetical protein
MHVIQIAMRVPWNAIRFSDKLYMRYQHLENVFRNEIGIPNENFPEERKDLMGKAAESTKGD